MATAINTNWLRNPQFDLSFIVGIATIGLLSGLAVVIEPKLFWPIFTVDLWLLGYHHLISTFTRLTFDRDSFKEHRQLVLGLPILVALATTLITLKIGVWMLSAIYLYWQWFHYTRQSEGISKAFRGRARNKFTGDQRLTTLTFWLIPLAGIATVSARNPQEFLFIEIKTLPIPQWLASFLIILSVIALTVWLYQHINAARKGELALPYFLYMCSHFIIYTVAYIATENITYGWLTINIWHNAQYILFVWTYNNRRFSGGVDSKHVFLSTISQSNRFVLYMAVCLTISTFVYYVTSNVIIDKLVNFSGSTVLVVSVIIYQTLNFHHYIVDSRIWKLRKKPVRENLGI